MSCDVALDAICWVTLNSSVLHHSFVPSFDITDALETYFSNTTQ